MHEIIEKKFICSDYDTALRVFGVGNNNLKIISQALDINYNSNGLELIVQGTSDKVDKSIFILYRFRRDALH